MGFVWVDFDENCIACLSWSWRKSVHLLSLPSHSIVGEMMRKLVNPAKLQRDGSIDRCVIPAEGICDGAKRAAKEEKAGTLVDISIK